VATDLQTMDLQGKVAVVTGGAAGIGFAISKGLAAAGVRVAVVDLDPTRGSDALAAEYRQHRFTSWGELQQGARSTLSRHEGSDHPLD
jgi:NAD(P)-dependent dehydrogenase (short-subunit alcohol dehydrogenase family)